MEGGAYLILGGALLGPDGSSLSLDSPLPLMRLHLLAVLALLHVRLRFFCSIPFPQANHARTGMCVVSGYGMCVVSGYVCRGMCVDARESDSGSDTPPSMPTETDRDSVGGEACDGSEPVSVPNSPTPHTDNTCVCNVCVQRVCVKRTNTAYEQRTPTLCVQVRHQHPTKSGARGRQTESHSGDKHRASQP